MIPCNAVYPFADRRTWITLVGTEFLGEFARRLQRSVVNRFEDLPVQQLSFFTLERISHQNEGVGQSLDTDSDGTVTEIRTSGLNTNHIIYTNCNPIPVENIFIKT